MPFVAPKGAANNPTAGSANRTTFRPPWVKEDGSSPLKPVSKTVPWAKKNTTTTPTTNADNGANNNEIVKKTTTTPNKIVDNNKKSVESNKKTVEPIVNKIGATVVKKTIQPAIKNTVESVKKNPQPAAAAAVTGKKPLTTTTKQIKKPTPPSSSSSEEEEEDDDDDDDEEEETESDEEETEEESEEEEEDIVQEMKKPTTNKMLPPSNIATNKNSNRGAQPSTPAISQPMEKTSELERRFSLEKPKLRPVIRRDKSIKKIEDDDEAEEGETEEDRARRLRFKLEKPKLRHIKREEKPLPSKSSENISKIRPVLKKVNKIDELIKEPKEEPKPEFKTKTLRKTPSIRRDPSIKNVPAPPPLPSLVPKAPPPPPPINGDKKAELNAKQKAALERLKSRPRRRPDWSEMMKEVESSRTLRHVECNDRSAPIVKCKSITKVDDKFVYETEKDYSHNKLLKQIQGGIKLRPTKTNDRSRPVLDGLRKFRRQMTIEEQVQRSQSKINMLGEAPPGSAAIVALGAGSTRGSIVSALSIDDLSADELDDIDNIRDDLQSTKQMLALELRNREAQERENKKLLAQIATLEAELAREKSREKNLEYGSNVIVATMEATPVSEECYLKSLKEEADEARQMAKDLEKKYLVTGELLDQAKTELDEQKRQIQKLERQLAQALQTGDPKICINGLYDIYFANDQHYNYKSEAMFHISEGGSLNGSRRPSDVNGDESAPEIESESDPDEPEEKKLERRERRFGKEVKVLRAKLTKTRTKEETAKKEKAVLKEAMKKNQIILKEENKKFKKLEKEVHKMAASMKEDNSDDECDDEKEEPEEEDNEEVSEDESEESESSESDGEGETESESEAEDASNLNKKNNLEPRVKKHEGRLNAMKKCNVLLQANVDNIQDEISQVRSRSSNLQAELDSVLADLGL